MVEANREVTGSLREKEDQGVIADITITPKGIPTGEHTSTQVHPVLGSTGGPGWMS